MRPFKTTIYIKTKPFTFSFNKLSLFCGVLLHMWKDQKLMINHVKTVFMHCNVQYGQYGKSAYFVS